MEKGELFYLLNPGHRVYGATKMVAEMVARKLGLQFHRDRPHPDHKCIGNKRRQMQYAFVPFKKKNVYFMLSPMVSLNAAEVLLRKIPAVMVEEYNPNNNNKDKIVKSYLAAYMQYPFICLNKRSHRFLEQNGINTFLVPPAQKKKQEGEKREIILFVGRFIKSKNPFLFLKIAEASPNEKFAMIGKWGGELEGEVRQRAAELGNVECMTNVSAEKVISYYKKAKILVHTAKDDPVGVVIPEALSFSIPVVASAGTGASDYLPTEWVVDGFNENNWISKVQEVLRLGEESIAKAKEAFENEHLDITDPYFKETSEDLAQYIAGKWFNSEIGKE